MSGCCRSLQATSTLGSLQESSVIKELADNHRASFLPISPAGDSYTYCAIYNCNPLFTYNVIRGFSQQQQQQQHISIMKFVVTFVVLVGVVYAIAYRNALAVGITHEQAVAFWKLQVMWVMGIAATFIVGATVYAKIKSRSSRSKAK